MKPAVLRAMLVIVLLSVQLATAVIVLYGMRHETVDQFEESTQSGLDRLATTVADQTQRFLAPAENALEVGRDLIAEGVLNAASDRDLERFFLAQLRSNPTLQGMHLARSNGSFISVERNDSGFITRQISITSRQRAVLLTQRDHALEVTGSRSDRTDSHDPRKETWYLSAQQQRSLAWTGVYSNGDTYGPGIMAALPTTFADGRDAGVLGVDVDISEISASLARLTGTRESTAVILDETHRAIAFSEYGQLAMPQLGDVMPSLESVAGNPLETLYRTIERPGAGFNALQAGLQRFEVAGEPHLGFVRSLEMSGGRLKWLLLVQAPANELAGSIGAFYTEKIRTLLAVIIVPAIIAILAVFGLTEPIYRLHEDATVDRLTRALTRAEFERRLEGMLRNRRELERDARIAVVALDLDGFKQVNDWYGHRAGDAVLEEFVRRLQGRLRQSDLVGRTGGDEFLVAMRLEGVVDPVDAIEPIRRDTVSRLFRVPEGKHRLGVTAGIACHEPGETMAGLIARADQALIIGKAREKDRSYLAPERDATWPETGFAVRRSSRSNDGITSATEEAMMQEGGPEASSGVSAGSTVQSSKDRVGGANEPVDG